MIWLLEEDVGVMMYFIEMKEMEIMFEFLRVSDEDVLIFKKKYCLRKYLIVIGVYSFVFCFLEIVFFFIVIVVMCFICGFMWIDGVDFGILKFNYF